MDFIIELIIDLLFGITEEAAKSKRLNNKVSILAIIFLLIFYLLVISLIFILGIMFYKDNIILSIIFIILGLLFLILSINKFKKVYLNKKSISLVDEVLDEIEKK